MRFDARTLILKDGTTVIQRELRISDAPALLEFLCAAAEETDFLLRWPEECASMTLAQEEAFIQRQLDSDTTLMTVCEVDGEIAGTCSLMFNELRKTRHRAGIAIALRQKFWGRGLGSALFAGMIALARQMGVRQLELEYVQGNDRGRALYDKMGFTLIGVRPNAFLQPDGTLADEYLMVKTL